MTADKPLKVSVEGIEKDKAILSLGDGQKIKIHSKFLPFDVKQGDTLYLDLLTEDQLKQSKEVIAKALLKELLKEGSDKEQKE